MQASFEPINFLYPSFESDQSPFLLYHDYQVKWDSSQFSDPEQSSVVLKVISKDGGLSATVHEIGLAEGRADFIPTTILPGSYYLEAIIHRDLATRNSLSIDLGEIEISGEDAIEISTSGDLGTVRANEAFKIEWKPAEADPINGTEILFDVFLFDENGEKVGEFAKAVKGGLLEVESLEAIFDGFEPITIVGENFGRYYVQIEVNGLSSINGRSSMFEILGSDDSNSSTSDETTTPVDTTTTTASNSTRESDETTPPNPLPISGLMVSFGILCAIVAIRRVSSRKEF